MYRLGFFFFNEPATTGSYPLSLYDALPIYLECLVEHGLKFPHRVRVFFFFYYNNGIKEKEFMSMRVMARLECIFSFR